MCEFFKNERRTHRRPSLDCDHRTALSFERALETSVLGERGSLSRAQNASQLKNEKTHSDNAVVGRRRECCSWRETSVNLFLPSFSSFLLETSRSLSLSLSRYVCLVQASFSVSLWERCVLCETNVLLWRIKIVKRGVDSRAPRSP